MKRVFTRSRLLFALFLLSAFSAFAFYALRSFWVFYTPMISFLGGGMGLFIIICAVAALSLGLFVTAYCRVKKNGKPLYKTKLFKVLAIVCAAFSVLSFVGVIVVVKISGSETSVAFRLFLKRLFPAMAVLLFAVVALVILPRQQGRRRTVLAECLALCVLVTGVCCVFPSASVKITSDPLVLDTGSDYAVVFGTSAPGTGFVEYSYGGTDYTVYDQAYGRRAGDRQIHSVHVPYKHLKNNTYTVGSTRVIEEYAYGSRLGKTVRSKAYTLTVQEGDTQVWLTLSDWHTHTDRALKAASYLGDYNAVILLGDPAPGMDFEEEALTYLVEFGGEVTHGEMPAVYVRGNHETRGAYADELPDVLGLEKLYYTVETGPYTFVVLDSGEDKPDDHIEYGGMDDYSVSRAEELTWLQTLNVNTDRVIALTHAWQVSEPEPEVSAAAWDEFARLGVKFVVSGHTHRCRFLDGATEEEQAMLSAHPDITAYIDGGNRDGVFIASKLTLSPTGVRFEAADQNGNKIVEEERIW